MDYYLLFSLAVGIGMAASRLEKDEKPPMIPFLFVMVIFAVIWPIAFGAAISSANANSPKRQKKEGGA